MPGKKTLMAFTNDGAVIRDKKAYFKHDFLVSDTLGWLVPPLDPTQLINWNGEDKRPGLGGMEYVLMKSPAPAEQSWRIIRLFVKVWREAQGGKRVDDSRVTESTRLQGLVAGLGALTAVFVLGFWFWTSATYELPPLPDSLAEVQTVDEGPVIEGLGDGT